MTHNKLKTGERIGATILALLFIYFIATSCTTVKVEIKNYHYKRSDSIPYKVILTPHVIDSCGEIQDDVPKLKR
jgi:hypothetical protein